MRQWLAKRPWVIPATVAVAGLLSIAVWLLRPSGKPLVLRVPGTDRAPESELGTNANAVLAGKLIRGDGQPADLPGAWPCFRGPNRDGIAVITTHLLTAWGAGEPRELWGTDVGEGYAGPAIYKGRVYLMDYDREKKQDALRCLSLADGKELWRFTYPVAVKRNHGMTRTVPSVDDRFVVAMGPKCHVVCLDAATGELRWGSDLAKDYGTTVPPWYAGQCPIIDGDRVILAPAGNDVLVTSLESATGKPVWTTPNPRGWKMTHSSIAIAEFGGEKMYVYCADKGVAAVSAKDGRLLWETTDWKISIATVPSPLVLKEGRIFFSGGYNAGSLMLQMKKEGDRIAAQTLFRLPPEVFGATQHTPILWEDRIYGTRADGRFVCVGLDGKLVWASDSSQQFGLGPFLMAGGKFFAVNDSGLLKLIDPAPGKYTLLAQAQVLKGRESWAPMAIAEGRLLVRDFTRLVCLEVGRK